MCTCRLSTPYQFKSWFFLLRKCQRILKANTSCSSICIKRCRSYSTKCGIVLHLSYSFSSAALFKLTVDSVLGYIPATAAPPSAGKQTGGEKKGMSPVIWAVPVAVVGLILVLVMTYFVRKSRRLERSMFALMTRRTIDDEGGVTFHSGTDRRTLQCI